MATDYGINLLKKGISQISDKKKKSIANKFINKLPKEVSLRTMVDLIDSEIGIKLDLQGKGNELYEHMSLCKKNNACFEAYYLNRCNSHQCPFYKED